MGERSQQVGKDRHDLARDAVILHGLTLALDALTWEDGGEQNASAVGALIKTVAEKSNDLLHDIEQGDFLEGSNA
ncbi:hypothetical protein Q5Y75_06640 [Ruegeria sp. 2205SS24-7]|uniref:hypothetical protein n=1 Tax=Ruegeria discodermiae TaxID=3064389 RepID=UPI0027412917|nr:hypothetical protein [Ruegeria sp. 2205SS24-7]MDP5216889.1 hypothetical protein [Ruegeria sp. 2205SS24-7]